MPAGINNGVVPQPGQRRNNTSLPDMADGNFTHNRRFGLWARLDTLSFLYFIIYYDQL